MDTKVIGVVLRYGFNDYGIMLADMNKEDENKILDIITEYEDDATEHRGTRETTLADANVGWLESEYSQRYIDTSTGGIVTLPTIFKRYYEINGSCNGFEEYVKDGFYNGSEQEYMKYDRNTD